MQSCPAKVAEVIWSMCTWGWGRASLSKRGGIGDTFEVEEAVFKQARAYGAFALVGWLLASPVAVLKQASNTLNNSCACRHGCWHL
eukprot:scaffold316919_cov19-Tisochrysis_lutea.AAC.1